MTPKTLELIEQFNPQPIHIPIDKLELEEIVETFFALMFPTRECPTAINAKEEMKKAAYKLHKNIKQIKDNEFADSATEAFFREFEDIRQRLYEDSYCYLQNDPAAKSIEEVVLTYPGFFALSVHRIAHELHRLNIPLIPRLFSEYAHAKVGIDIHPAATIGKNFFMDHGTGIVIGETTEIGDNVKVYQGVTLGALYVEKKLSDIKRHPTVEDNVVIYANATLLGGETVVGRNSIIGGGAWLTQSVPPNSLVYTPMDIKIRTVKDSSNSANQ